MALTQLKTSGIADDAVTTDKLANAINTERTANTAKVSLDADSVTGAKIADDAIDSEHYTDGSIDTAHIADGAVNEAKLVDIASGRIMGRLASGTGSMTQLTATSVRSIINVADGATNSPTTTINNNADNRVITGSGTANTLEGEDKLTWNGNNLHIERTVTAYEQPLVNIYNSGAYGWGGAIRFSANWANTEEHQAMIKTYGGSSATGASLAFNVGAANSEKLRIQNGGGISFNGDTAAANALDDYEEGTFTPTYLFGSSDTATYTARSGSYTKIGNLVFAKFSIDISSRGGSGSGAWSIGGMPFAFADKLGTTGQEVGGNMTYWNNTAAWNQLFFWGQNGETKLQIQYTTGSGNTTPQQWANRGNLNDDTGVRGWVIYQA